MTPQEINAYISQLFPGVRLERNGGSDGDSGNEQWVDNSGFGKDIKASQIWDLATQLNSMQNNTQNGGGNPGMAVTDDRLRQILSGAAQGGFSDFSQVGNYLNPQENQQFNAWKNWVDQENADMSFGDYLAMGTFALGAGALGGAAFGGFGGAPVDPSWGVNAATGAAEAGALGGAQPWWAELGSAGMGDPLTAAGIGGGATPAGVGLGMGAAPAGGFNVADFINNGTLPGGGSVSTPPIPGAGNGVGLTEVAQAGLQSGAGTALSRVINGTATAADWAQIAGGVGSAGLGMLGANAQGKAYSDVADKYLGLGAPYRSKLEASYGPGFDMATADPAFQGALDQSAQAAARSWSARSGNPADNPGVQSEINKYVLNSSYLPQLNTYRSQLGSFGQLGTNTAGTNDTQAAGQTSGMYNAAGYGLGQLTQPKNPYEDAMKGLLGGFKLNNGYSF